MNGEHHYDGKHLKDIIRLFTLLEGEEKVQLTGMPSKDFKNFLPVFNELENDRVRNILKGSKLFNFTKEDLLKLLERTYLK